MNDNMKHDVFVAMDRTTACDLLPMVMSKAIPGDVNALPSRDSVLAAERIRLGRDTLTNDEARAALAVVGEYTDQGYAYRDFGAYCVGIKTDNGMRVSGKPSTLCYRVGNAVLGEVYQQKALDNVEITKEKLLRQHLGYAADETQAYREVWDALNSLRKLDYVVWDCRHKPVGAGKPFATGNFIYNLVDKGDSYVISVNPYFVGCVQHILDGNKRLNKQDRTELLHRGYFHMPMAILPQLRHSLVATCLLTNFLVRDSGNDKIPHAQDEKVVAYAIPRYIEEAGIRRSTVGKAYRHFLDALRQCPVVMGTDPGMTALEKLKPSKIGNVVLRIRMRSNGAAKPYEGEE